MPLVGVTSKLSSQLDSNSTNDRNGNNPLKIIRFIVVYTLNLAYSQVHFRLPVPSSYIQRRFAPDEIPAGCRSAFPFPILRTSDWKSSHNRRQLLFIRTAKATMLFFASIFRSSPISYRPKPVGAPYTETSPIQQSGKRLDVSLVVVAKVLPHTLPMLRSR